MSHDDDHRHDPRRGAYTPPDEDDLPFRRSGFDARPGGRRLGGGGGGGRPVPVTLIVSAGVLLVLILVVILFYRSGLRASEDAPAVGQPVEQMTVPPVDAQPVDPQLGIDVYDPAAEMGEPQFAPPPEAVQPRPEPQPLPAPSVTPPPIPGPAPTRPETRPTPTPTPTPPPAEKTRPAPAPATGSASVQIGAFSSRALADREYAAVAGAFPQFASGRTKSVEQVTTSAGSTAYRTAVSGFSREQAQEFCAALRAAGRECFVR